MHNSPTRPAADLVVVVPDRSQARAEPNGVLLLRAMVAHNRRQARAVLAEAVRVRRRKLEDIERDLEKDFEFL